MRENLQRLLIECSNGGWKLTTEQKNVVLEKMSKHHITPTPNVVITTQDDTISVSETNYTMEITRLPNGVWEEKVAQNSKK